MQQRPAPVDVRRRHRQDPVEPAGSDEGLVEDTRLVGRGDHDEALVLREAVHLDQQRVERLRVQRAALVVPRGADRVDLVDEDDRRRQLPRGGEERAHAACADADVLLVEAGGGGGEEGHARLAGDGAREERLARARRPLEQHAARHLRAEPREGVRVAQEGDGLAQLRLHLVDAVHVVEARRAVGDEGAELTRVVGAEERAQLGARGEERAH
mmetsp:Transcript_46831/g.107560  ORF Transcript_46831/g.107560 Transcript_46831/m.107560 type:complete len:213 (-) Transcript_46831:133-771(-)